MNLADRIVVLDLDQTLIASGNYTAAFEATCRELGGSLDAAMAVWHRSPGRPVHDTLGEIYNIDSLNPWVIDAVARFWEHVGDGDPTPLDGAHVTLAALAELGVTMLLTTGSHPDPMERWLRELGWWDLFTLAQGSTHKHAKGQQHYQAMYKHTEFSPAEFGQRAAVVGDGIYDMRFGVQHDIRQRIGYTPPGCNPNRRGTLIREGATHIIEDLRDLPALLACGHTAALRAV